MIQKGRMLSIFICLIPILLANVCAAAENSSGPNLKMKRLSFKDAAKIVIDVSEIWKIGQSHTQQQQAYQSKVKSVEKKQIIHQQAENIMVDNSVISLIERLPQVYELAFYILDEDHSGEVTQIELVKVVMQVYKHSKDQEFINKFGEELFQKVNKGKSFNFQQFHDYFSKFLISLEKNPINPFTHTPPFQKDDIKGLILFLSSGRRNWDMCFITAFHVLDLNKDRYVTQEEVKQFLEGINSTIWKDAEEYVNEIWKYMRLTGTASGTSINIGGLITFAELVRPYIPKILDKYIV